MHIRCLLISVLCVLYAHSAHAWNALGHKTVAEIAWRQLDPDQRQQIVDILRRHPRFDVDFAGKMTDDVLKADKSTQDRWVFQHAAYWPDIARQLQQSERATFDRPQWHYIDYPLFLDVADRSALADKLTVNLGTDYRKSRDKKSLNVLQAIGYATETVKGNAGVVNKALAYCWLFHLVGDVHQPCHSTSLFCVNHFPDGEGDRGGNEIPISRGENLHALWDNLLSRQHFIRDVDKTVYELRNQRFSDVWKTASEKRDPRQWAQESHELCTSFVYDSAILDIVRATPAGSEIAKIQLPVSYYQDAGDHARRRIIAAGIRLAALLGGKAPSEPSADDEDSEFFAAPLSAAPVQSNNAAPVAESTSLTHWLNIKSGVRHNSSCRNYKNVKNGRACTADEGKPCGICGG